MTLKKLAGLQKNTPLAEYTTFKIGGPAKYFFEAKTKEEIIRAILWAKKQGLAFFILAGGSNLLVADEGYKGLVINFQFSIFNFQNSKIVTGAGLPLSKLVSASAERGLIGLEWAAGIPGTVGGAIRGNAGAFGNSMADVTKTVTVLEIRNPKSEIFTPLDIKLSNGAGKSKYQNPKFKTRIFKNKDCQFGYRDSVFKHNQNLIILSAELQLKKGKKSEIEKRVKEHLTYRRNNHPLRFASAGSVFKNYKVESLRSKALERRFRLLPLEFRISGMVPAGFLIEKCGLKGKKIGQVQVSEKHANFIVNLGGAQAKEVIKLIKLIKKKVKEKFSIALEEEIQYLGY